MKTYEALKTTPTSDQILAARVLALRGLGRVSQAGGVSGLGDGTGTLSVSGSASADASVVVHVVTAGEPGGGATYQLSLDGGRTWGAAQAMPAGSVALGSTGAVVTFIPATDGSSPSFFADDEYAFEVRTPVVDATAWQDETVPRRLMGIESDAAADLGEASAAVASGAYLRDAAGGWVDLHASDVFGEGRQKAQFAQGQLTLTDGAGVGPVTVSPGSLWAGPGDGSLRFSNLDGGSIPLNGSLKLTFKAEQAGASYNLPNGTIAALLTPIAGVDVKSVSMVGAVTRSRLASPWMTARGADVVTGDYDIVVQVTGTITGGVTYRYSLDGGATWGSTMATTSGVWVAVSTTGLSILFPAGSYVPGDSFSFSASASWLSSPGVDVESDDRVKTRCRAKWATLAAGYPTDLLTKTAMDAAVEITKVFCRASESVAGQVEVWLGGVAGGVTSPAVAAADAALQPYAPLCTTILTQSADTMTVTVAGTVFVKAGKTGLAQSNSYAALAAYQAETPIGGNIVTVGSAGIVSLEAVIGCLIGGKNLTLVVDLNLTEPTADGMVGDTQAVVFDLSGLTWTEV